MSFRIKKLKLEYVLMFVFILTSFNFYFFNYLHSSVKQNSIISISNVEPISINLNEEIGIELQSNIVSWADVLAKNPNLSNLDYNTSFPESALVKVREDNKIEFIVKRDVMEFSSQTSEFLSKYNVEFYEEASYFNASIVYISLDNLEKFIPESKLTPGVAYVEPNFYDQLDFVPNDEYYASDQWSLPLIGMESAWDYELGSHDILVAVVDTGIDYTHPDLSENYLALGYDWVNDDDDPMDDHYHGTHCAGTIAALINNTEGVAGMANVSIFAEKSFNSGGSGAHSDSRLALMHAVDMGANIISCSWGGSTYSLTIKEAIDYALNNSVMVVAAAGNGNSDTPHYPAAYPGVIAVCATDENDNRAYFSNYGDWVDISAPGIDILSTVPYYLKGTYYSFASGTSMATPHVAGLAALLKSAFPANNATQIEALIYESAIDLWEPGFDIYYGYGRIDATNIFGPDISPPTYSNLIESADPLLLGSTEIITIDVSDLSGVNQVLIEFEGSNHSMSKVGVETWRYDSWTPSATGIYPYKIYMEDINSLWSSISDSIEVKEDTEPPVYSNLQESADPLELGNTEIVSISITDLSGINQVVIEFEGSNHSMVGVGSNTWQYDTWVPSFTGIYPYTIYMEDNYDHWNSVSNSIQVVDTISPTCIILTNNTSPLELGNSRLIQVKVVDISDINQVLIEFEGSTDNLTELGGDVWQYKDFIPSNIGTCTYTIHMEDNNDNWASISDSVDVRDTIAPYAPILIEYPSGDISDNISFDWEDGYDPSGILYYKLIIDNESFPLITPGNIFEVEIENLGPESSGYELEEPLDLGTYYFFLYQTDGAGHQSASATGIFTVTLPNSERGAINFTPIVSWLFIIGIAVAIPSYAVSKSKKNGKSNIFIDNFEIKNLKGELKELRNKKKKVQKAAEIAVKYGNYAKAADLYEECEDISNQIFKNGNIAEAETTKYYANMKSKAFQAREQIDSYVTYSINEFLTNYFDNIRIKYYSYPQVYDNSKKVLNGWLLNDKKFIQHRLTNPKNGLKLVQETGFHPENLSHITAIHFAYTSDLTFNSIIKICQEHQNAHIITFIVGLGWPLTFQERNSFAPPEDNCIEHRNNIRIINTHLFADLIGLEGEYRQVFFKIFKS
ncbi:MAG: S8 family serine peptidase [Candidatus Hodarchaeota archaeon]